ncbi:MAG: aldo/keto reductase [Sneathiella sp.]|nr:aldo/keto reductase [Sneathiella sp.]
MEHIVLGRTGLSSSRAGLGCGGHSRLGQGYGSSHKDSVDVVRAAIDMGINFVDTAKVYGTESIVGEALSGRRDQVILSSKGQIIKSGHSPLGRDYISAEDLQASLEASLKNLKTDYLDIYHLHGILPHQYDICLDHFLPILKDAQKAGKTRFIGITERFIHDPAHQMLQSALADNHWDVVMAGFNMINPSARNTVFPQTQKYDVGVLNMFAVRNALGHPQSFQALLEHLQTEGHIALSMAHRQDLIEELMDATRSGSLTEAAYRFCCHEAGNHVVLTGTGNIDHLRSNIDAISGPKLSESLLERLENNFGHISTVSGD